MQVECSAACGSFEMHDVIAGRGEQTFTIKIFGIGKHLRDASVMHHDRGRVSARCDGCCRGEWTRIRRERRQKIEPIAHRARDDGSQRRPQAQSIDQLQRRKKRAETIRIRENRADSATLQSIDEAATMIALDE